MLLRQTFCESYCLTVMRAYITFHENLMDYIFNIEVSIVFFSANQLHSHSVITSIKKFSLLMVKSVVPALDSNCSLCLYILLSCMTTLRMQILGPVM